MLASHIIKSANWPLTSSLELEINFQTHPKSIPKTLTYPAYPKYIPHVSVFQKIKEKGYSKMRIQYVYDKDSRPSNKYQCFIVYDTFTIPHDNMIWTFFTDYLQHIWYL